MDWIRATYFSLTPWIPHPIHRCLIVSSLALLGSRYLAWFAKDQTDRLKLERRTTNLSPLLTSKETKRGITTPCQTRETDLNHQEIKVCWYGLISRVAIAASYYLAIDISFNRSIVPWMFHSNRISDVAISRLDWAVSISPTAGGASCEIAYMMAIVPVALQVLHLGLLYLRLYHLNTFQRSEWVEKKINIYANRLTNCLHLHVAILYLAQYGKIDLAICCIALNAMLSQYYPLGRYNNLATLTILAFKVHQWFSLVGFTIGFETLCQNIFYIAAPPLNMETLKEAVQRLSSRSREEIQEIVNSLEATTVFPHWDVLKQLWIEILCLDCSLDRLEPLHQSLATIVQQGLSHNSQALTSVEKQFLQEQLLDKMVVFYQNTVEPYLQTQVDYLKRESVKDAQLQLIFGRGSCLETIDSSQKWEQTQYQFLWSLFKLQFDWYYQNQQKLTQQQQLSCEWLIIEECKKHTIARPFAIETSWATRPIFTQWAQKKNIKIEELKQKSVSDQLSIMHDFNQDRHIFGYNWPSQTIDASFQFKTVSLPLTIGWIQYVTGSQQAIFEHHFPSTTRAYLILHHNWVLDVKQECFQQQQDLEKNRESFILSMQRKGVRCFRDYAFRIDPNLAID